MTLPRGWAQLPLGDLGNWSGGGTPSKSNPSFWKEGTIPWVSPKDMKRPFISEAEDCITAEAVTESATNLIEPGSVLLVTRSGILRHSLPVALTTAAVAINQDLKALQPRQGVLGEYVRYFFATHANAILHSCAKSGTTVDSIDFDRLKQFRFPLPPLAEQRRIVKKLDALTARITRARAELERVPVLAKNLRQNALSICFSGAGTHIVNLGEILRGIEAGKNLRCEERPPEHGERGVVKVSAVTWGRFDPEQSKTLPGDYTPPEKARIRAGDLLISRANTLELVGAIVLVEEQPENLFLSDKILRLDTEEQFKRWLLWFLRSPEGRKQIENLATGNQLSMRNISQEALRSIRLPLPSSAEREQLLSVVESAFTRADRLEAEAARAKTLLDRLESAILAKAFKGELVPQDPEDEPAEALLARIRATSTTAPAKRGRRVKENA